MIKLINRRMTKYKKIETTEIRSYNLIKIPKRTEESNYRKNESIHIVVSTTKIIINTKDIKITMMILGQIQVI